MKERLKQLFRAAMVVVLVSSSTAAETSLPLVSERGPHHRVWQRVSERARADGKVAVQTNSYVELASGLHYLQDGQWVESKEEIELFEGGAIARQGQHQVIWAPNINSAGAIDLVTSDGKRFRSHILGLAYTDAATGESVMIAEIKDSTGQLVAPNQIIYSDAFTDFRADVRYTYTIGGFEQDIILRQEPPSPAFYGLNPETTLLEAYTEFIEAPVPSKKVNVIRQENDPLLRAVMEEPDLTDEMLNFGTTIIGPGNAFPLEHGLQADEMETVPVGKSWETREGRQLLIEKVDYAEIQPHLAPLPKTANASKPKAGLAKAKPVKRKDCPSDQIMRPA